MAEHQLPNVAPTVVRARNGRFVGRVCPDPNCCGVLVAEDDHSWPGSPSRWWRCDGLTYERDDGELEACTRTIER